MERPEQHDVNGKTHPDLMTVPEVAARLRISVSQAYALVNTGRLRAHKFTTGKSGCIRVSESQLQKFLRESQQ